MLYTSNIMCWEIYKMAHVTFFFSLLKYREVALTRCEHEFDWQAAVEVL